MAYNASNSTHVKAARRLAKAAVGFARTLRATRRQPLEGAELARQRFLGRCGQDSSSITEAQCAQIVAHVDAMQAEAGSASVTTPAILTHALAEVQSYMAESEKMPLKTGKDKKPDPPPDVLNLIGRTLALGVTTSFTVFVVAYFIIDTIAVSIGVATILSLTRISHKLA